MRELTSAKWIVAKGFLLLALGLLAAATLLLMDSRWKQAALLAVTVWAFCRFYYFLFYVLERYIDPSFRFSGVWSVVLYVLRKRGNSRRHQPN